MQYTNRSYIRKIRYVFQWLIFVSIIYAGFKFYLFTKLLEQGQIPTFERPSSIEGFMPIGALMALKLWISEGIFDPIHPAALVIFIGAITIAILLKKSFCGWICPVGTLSDSVWRLGKRLFGRNFVIPKYIDYLLRSLKYIFMTFFLYVIIIKMTPFEIAMFLNTSYWKVADIKLLKFFTEMSLTTGITLSVLFGISLLYKNFWCRYLCPYGGLLGLLSILSPTKIKRDEDRCIKCGLCAKNCPSLLPVDKKITITSPECTGCLTCVSYCPKRGALDIAFLKEKICPEIFILFIFILFFGIIFVAKLNGKWHPSLSVDEIKAIMPYIPNLRHP